MMKRLAPVCVAVAMALAGCSPALPQAEITQPEPVTTLGTTGSAATNDVWVVPASEFGVAVVAPVPTGWLIATSPYDIAVSNTPVGQPPAAATFVVLGAAVPAGSDVRDRVDVYASATEAIDGIVDVSAPRESEVDGHSSVSIDYSIEQEGVLLAGTMTWVIVDDVEVNLTQSWAPGDTAGAQALTDIMANMRIG